MRVTCDELHAAATEWGLLKTGGAGEHVRAPEAHGLRRLETFAMPRTPLSPERQQGLRTYARKWLQEGSEARVRYDTQYAHSQLSECGAGPSKC
jgi:hypothetical protein